MVKSILCPIDRSPSSLQAFDYALALARWRGARLILLEVAEATMLPGIPRAAKASRLSKDTRLALDTDLHRVLAAKRASDVNVEIVLREGNVVREILLQADASRSDLVVIGSHGPGGVRRPMGSVAETVLRLANCPVLTVRRGVKQGNPCGPPFATILCPTDFSAAANQAMACAKRLTKQAGATLTAMSVIEPSVDRSVRSRAPAEMRDSAMSEKRNRLARLKAGANSDGPRVQAVVTFGKAASEIVAYGLKRGVDLVVMGISGHGASEAVTLGSTSHYVIRKGSWPVLTVRSSSHAIASVSG